MAELVEGDRGPAAGAGRLMDAGTRYARLDAEYLLKIRPFLNDCESRVYEALVLSCDGWSRPTSSAQIASITRLHLDSVRKAIRSLERLGLIRSHWTGSPTSPQAKRSVEIVRQYAPVLKALRRAGRAENDDVDRGASCDSHGDDDSGAGICATEDPDPPTDSLVPTVSECGAALGDANQSSAPTHGDRTQRLWVGEARAATTLGPAAQRLWTERPRVSGLDDPDPSLARSSKSDPDLPPSPPSLRRPRSPEAIDPEEGTNEGRIEAAGSEPSGVPGELIALCRKLWTTNVTRKAARRYLAPLLRVGAPPASAEELERYLRASAEKTRVRKANFPIAAACMPEEFADWLELARRPPLTPPARASPAGAARPSTAEAIPLGELGERARRLCANLARTEPDPTDLRSEHRTSQHHQRAAT